MLFLYNNNNNNTLLFSPRSNLAQEIQLVAHQKNFSHKQALYIDQDQDSTITTIDSCMFCCMEHVPQYITHSPIHTLHEL